jgi:hypothetical protein
VSQLKGGIIQLQINGVIYDVKGEVTYNLGVPKRKAIVGVDGVHGFTEEPQPSSAECILTDRGTLDAAALFSLKDATVAVVLANGKTVSYRDAWYAGEGTGKTNEGEIDFRIESASQAQEIGG